MGDVTWSGNLLRVEAGRSAHSLFVRDVGPRSKSAILFLHGFPTSSLDWSKIAPRFQDWRTIYVDLLGFGHSAKPRLRYSYPLQADLVQNLLKRLGVGSVALVAHDYSVTLAQELLRRQQSEPNCPCPIGKVVFLNGGVYGHLHRQQRFHRLLLTPVVGGLAARRIRPKALASGFNAIAGRLDAWSETDAREHWEAMSANGGLGRLPRLVHYIADRHEHGAVWEPAMEAAADRIGFVWGPDDPVSGAHVLAEIRARLPNSPAISVAGTGHYPHWEAPRETADAVLSLLKGDS